MFVFSALELPFGKGKRFGPHVNRAVDDVKGGWKVNTIATVNTGPLRGDNKRRFLYLASRKDLPSKRHVEQSRPVVMVVKPCELRFKGGSLHCRRSGHSGIKAVINRN